MRLRYRSVVDSRDLLAYAPWVRELRYRNGVYVIREVDSREVVYVGESHSGRLYSTLTRHFQFWDGYTAGMTYDRDGVEVATCALDASAREVVAKQIELIGELAPLDNTHHQRDLFDEDEGLDSVEFEDDW